MAQAVELHPITLACMGFHLWSLEGLGQQGGRMEAAVTAARIAASEEKGAVFAPLAMGGAGGLRTGGPPAEMYWLNLQDASDLNITNGKEWSRVWLEPYKKGIVAAIRRKDSYSGYEIYSPHDLISQATFFCRGNEKVLMLSASAMSPTDPFNKMVGFKFIDQEQNIKSIELTDTYTFREGPNDKIWFDISLNNLIVNQILSAVRMKVYFGMYGASGGPQSFEYDLKAMDRQMIQSSFQFCIE